MQNEPRLMVPESEFEIVNKIYIALVAGDYLHAASLFLEWNKQIRTQSQDAVPHNSHDDLL